jgi:hypothetical protein
MKKSCQLTTSLARHGGSLSLRELAWPMAVLQARHPAAVRLLSAAMVEALAAAHHLHAGIAVSTVDVGRHLRTAARADKIPFHTI